MGLARYLGLKLSTMSPAARLRFAQRTSLFHAEPEEGTVLEIDFGQDAPHVLMPSSDAGGRTRLRATVAVAPEPRHAPWLRFHARVPGPRPRIEGRALLVPAQGLSVISDIDDTVKKTRVRDQQQMLLNTFARAFRSRAGHGRALPRAGAQSADALSLSLLQPDPAAAGPGRLPARHGLSAGQHAFIYRCDT